MRQPGGNEATAKAFVTKLYKNVPVLDAGARGSTTTFVERGIGDVLLAWENEALLAIKELGPDKFEIVAPVAQHPGRAAGDGGGQGGREARHHGGGPGLPRVPVHARQARRSRRSTSTGRALAAVAAKYAGQFPKVTLFTIDEVFGGWKKAQAAHFADGGVFDQIYQPGR